MGTGYYGGGTDGWLAGVSAVGGAVRINAAENWSATNAGTSFTVALTPVGAYAGTNFTALSMTSAGKRLEFVWQEQKSMTKLSKDKSFILSS